MRDTPAPNTSALDAQHTLSGLGEHYLAACWPTHVAWRRWPRPPSTALSATPPTHWPRNGFCGGVTTGVRCLRVVGQAGDPATRIENRIGEPAANPYLYIASQIHAGLDSVARQLKAPPASTAPYDAGNDKLPTSLGEALDSLQADDALVRGLGQEFVGYYTRIKQQELRRFGDAEDKLDWQRREYFSRF